MKNKVLFVEDEEDLALIVADTLRGLGYEVVTAADGCGWIGKIQVLRCRYYSCRCDDASDGRLLNGQEIRKLSPIVPLLFLTAKSTIEDVEKGFGNRS